MKIFNKVCEVESCSLEIVILLDDNTEAIVEYRLLNLVFIGLWGLGSTELRVFLGIVRVF